jgi:hypothetical protein
MHMLGLSALSTLVGSRTPGPQSSHAPFCPPSCHAGHFEALQQQPPSDHLPLLPLPLPAKTAPLATGPQPLPSWPLPQRTGFVWRLAGMHGKCSVHGCAAPLVTFAFSVCPHLLHMLHREPAQDRIGLGVIIVASHATVPYIIVQSPPHAQQHGRKGGGSPSRDTVLQG